MSSSSVQFIPFDIQGEILKSMDDVKSLIRFRSISKAWKFLIESPKFIADHHQRAAAGERQRRHLIVHDDDDQDKCVSIIDDNDDECLPPEHYSTTHGVMGSIVSIGSSDGLLGYERRCDGTLSIVLWNPTIKKSVPIGPVPYNDINHTYLGFGVCPGTSDPKLVKIDSPRPSDQYSDDDLMMPLEVEVCTLSSGVWRSPLGTSSKLPCKSIALSAARPVVISSIIYWLACKNSDDLIISFDLITEEFEQINFPPDNSVKSPMTIANRRESLVLLEYCYNEETEAAVCGVWVMNHPKSFTKLYSVIKEKVPSDGFLFLILEFRKNGDPILETRYGGSAALELYEPCSESFIDLGFRSEYSVGSFSCYTVTSYTETLLLLDHQSADSTIQE